MAIISGRSGDASPESPADRRVAGYFWSSSENNNNNAWIQRFSDGNQNNNNKNNSRAVRCFRRVAEMARPVRAFGKKMSRPPEIVLETHPDRPLDWDDPQSGPTLEAVFDAYFDCRKHKRNTESQLGFEIDLERNLVALWRDLRAGRYEIGASDGFVVTKPKLREVWAAQFRDRVVHHLLYNALADRFTRRFIRDSYASIPGRGTLDAMHRARGFARSVSRNYAHRAYVIKIDVASFFTSIDRERLVRLIVPHVPEPWLMQLATQIALHDVRHAPNLKSSAALFAEVPWHKSLLRAPEGKGLPIGNLTSQFFANIYLHELDHFVKHDLKMRCYGRYVDDMILLDTCAAKLCAVREQIDGFLQEHLLLQLNPVKTWMNTVQAGFDFVGYVIRPGRVYLRRNILARARGRVKVWEEKGSLTDMEGMTHFSRSVTSTLAMLRHVNGYRARQALCGHAQNLFLRADPAATKLMRV